MRLTTAVLIAALAAVTAAPLSAQTPPRKPVGELPPIKTPVTADDLRIVERAAQLLDSPTRWNRVDTTDCVPGAKTLSLDCALEEASREIAGRVDDQSAAMQEARVTVWAVAARSYGGRLSGYNDDSTTTFNDLQQFFRIVRNRLVRRMAEENPSTAYADSGGPSQARPPVTQADLRIVQRAREILDSPAKWNRADTRTCPEGARTFSLYCALAKATQEVTGSFAHRGAAMQEARFVIDDMAANAPYYSHRLMYFNNDPATTFFDVEKFFQLLEARISARLAGR